MSNGSKNPMKRKREWRHGREKDGARAASSLYGVAVPVNPNNVLTPIQFPSLHPDRPDA